uniref:Uncharacterized protein n=1 Tax=Arundo donax TaxID=35708 RepID=A0A0A9FYA4_ARUDO
MLFVPFVFLAVHKYAQNLWLSYVNKLHSIPHMYVSFFLCCDKRLEELVV